MYTTTDETGRLNNYATEPEMYFAAYPSPEQQRSYVKQGSLAVLFAVSLLFLAFAVS